VKKLSTKGDAKKLGENQEKLREAEAEFNRLDATIHAR
jgi:hypothetical protein